MEAIAMLIQNGHANVVKYTYSFFIICLRTLEQQKKQEIAGMSYAVGLAFSGKDAVQNFLKG